MELGRIVSITVDRHNSRSITLISDAVVTRCMPKYLVMLPREEERRARALIEKGIYRDMDHLVNVAVHNQVVAEVEEVNPWGTKPPRGRSSDLRAGGGVPKDVPEIGAQVRFFSSASDHKPVTLPEPKDEDLAGTLFWAQFYRILPIKVVGRVLHSLTQDALVSYADYGREAVQVASGMYGLLRSFDAALGLRQGEKFSTSFPRRSQKSLNRFADQFLPYVRPKDRRLDGFLARLKFANVVDVGGEYEVGLTLDGAEFMALHNPVLDDDPPGRRSLSASEVAFLIRHIHRRLPAEYRHMIALLEAVAEGATTPESLDMAMGVFYRNLNDFAKGWSEKHIKAMRGGVQSRLRELGLFETDYEGRTATYCLTSEGMSLLREGPPGMSPSPELAKHEPNVREARS